MSKGLEVILEKIKANPSPTLVSRYLALIADLKDEATKATRALDLAAVLVKDKPAEAMRIAHMVHQAAPEDPRALEIIVDSLKARGRFAKAEMVLIEKEKLLAPKLAVASPDVGGAASAPAMEGSRIAELDIGAEAKDATVSEVDLARLFPREEELAEAPMEPAVPHAPAPAESAPAPESLHIVGASNYQVEPGDTVLPFRRGVREHVGSEAPTVSLSAAPKAAKPMRTEAFWRPLNAELARLARLAKLPGLSTKQTEAMLSPLRIIVTAKDRSAQLPETFLKAIAEIDKILGDTSAERRLASKWELIFGLWGASPDAGCAQVLERANLQRASLGFWGLYLDSLLSSGNARKALVEVRRGLAEHAELDWARVACRRLPEVCRRLRLRPFSWREEEGVHALLEVLAKRPTPSLTSLLA